MKYDYACVADADGYYVTFVLVVLEPDVSGVEQPVVQSYTLKDGEKLGYVQPPAFCQYAGADGLIRPKWDDTTDTWAEGAAAAEIAAWEKAHPAPPVPPPTAEERLRADIDYLALMGGVAL